MKNAFCIFLTLCMLLAPSLYQAGAASASVRISGGLDEQSYRQLCTLADENNWRVSHHGEYIEVDFQAGAALSALASFNRWQQNRQNQKSDKNASTLGGNFANAQQVGVLPAPVRSELLLSGRGSLRVNHTGDQSEKALAEKSQIAVNAALQYEKNCRDSHNIQTYAASQLFMRGPPATL